MIVLSRCSRCTSLGLASGPRTVMRASTTGTTAGQMARRVGAVSGYQASYASCVQ